MSLKWFQTFKPHLQAVGGPSSHHFYFRFYARDGAHLWDRCIGTGPSPLSACVSCGAWTASASRNPSVVRWWTNSTAVVVWRSYRVCHPWSWTQGRQGLKIFAVGHPLLYIYIYLLLSCFSGNMWALSPVWSTVARLTCHMTALLCSLLAPQLHDLRAKEVIVVARAFSPERIPDVFWSRCLDLLKDFPWFNVFSPCLTRQSSTKHWEIEETIVVFTFFQGVGQGP